MFNPENLKAGDVITYTKADEPKSYTVYADADNCIILSPVSDDPKWIKGLLLKNQQNGKILAVSATQQENLHKWGRTFSFLGECLIKEARQKHDTKGLIYSGTDKYDGQTKIFVRVNADIIGFDTL